MKKSLSKLLMLFYAIMLIFPVPAGAVLVDGNAVGGVRVLVSKDGTNWLNYSNSNSESPTGQTLTVNPGDKIYFKGEVWNAGETDINPLIIAYIKNAKYLQDIGAFDNAEGDDDLDNDGINYMVLGTDTTDEYVVMGLAFSVPLTAVPPVGTQSGMIQATVKSDVPPNTLIEGVFVLVANNNIGPNGINPQDAFTDGMEQMPEKGKVHVLANEVSGAPVQLPRTGTDINVTVYALLISLSVLSVLGTVKFLKTKK